MKKVLILEDKEIHRKTLTKILEEINAPLQIYSAETVAEAYQISMEHTINLFLVDIILDTEIRGDVSGLKFVESIRKIPQYSFTPIIFTTSLEDPELHAYKDLHCYGYIEKPFDKEVVKNLIKETLNFPETGKSDENVYFRNDGIVYSIKAEDIVYIEVSRKEIIIHTTKEDMTMSYMPVNQILDKLDSSNFIQCNRGCIINKKHVEYMDYVNRYIKLRGVDNYVEIGRAMKARLLDEFRD